MTKDEALKLALECLDGVWRGDYSGNAKEVITAIKEALANEALEKMAENARELGLDYEPEQDGQCKYCTDGCPACDARKLPKQKPVAWLSKSGKGLWFHEPDANLNATPLYTTPPQRTWVGLTDEEIKRLGDLDLDSNYFGLWYDFARAIEAKLRSKNS